MNLSTSLLEIRLGQNQKLFEIDSLTAIDKQTVSQVEVHALGLVGDQQAESFHGGTERALLQFDCDHYAILKQQFPESETYFKNGGFGENLVAQGFNEHNICIGDQISIGSVILEVSQPRQPCFKLNYRFKQQSLSQFSQDNSITGWFYRVIKPGVISTDDSLELIARPLPQWTIAQVQYYLYHDLKNQTAMQQLLELPQLAKETKSVFEKRMQRQQVENWQERLVG
ncbi:MOSC domain-containing protein [Pelagibaculum spongiae]|nr:MOSC domain-containing protein [Pelagibaculum spongiae]